MFERHLKQWIILQPKNELFKLLEPNSSYRISFDNAPKLTKLDRVKDPPLSLVQDSEEERLETSNAIITIREEDSKPTIAPLVTWEITIVPVIKTSQTKHDPIILHITLPML